MTDKFFDAMAAATIMADGAGFNPDAEQLAAINSGITTTDVEQITTNKNNILTVANQSTKYNLSMVSTGTVSGAGYIIPLTNITMPIGDYVVKWSGTATTGASAIAINDADGNRLITQNINNATNVLLPITISGVGKQFSVYCNTANTITDFCIIPKQLYDAGFTDYQPYALSNAELTEKEIQNANNISLEQAKTTGMSEGGTDYITVNGIRVYVSATAPTGARTGDLWIGG